MADAPSRCTAFVREILTADEPRNPDREHLESLLHWLAGRDTPQAKAIQAAFDHHQVSSNAAQRHTLNYLDRVLFAHDADPYRLFGLIPGCDFADIRARHKQLMQVFHPDRHQQHKDWFTRRSERLNHAYAHLKQNHAKQSAARQTTKAAAATPARRAHEPQTPNPKPRKRTPNAQPRAPSTTHLRSRLKEHLGNPAKLQQRAFIVLFTVPAVLLLVLYVNNQGDVVGDSAVTITKNDPAPRTPEPSVSIMPRDPTHLAGTPTNTTPAGTPLTATDPEPLVDATTVDPEPLKIASRSLDEPHNGDRDSTLNTDIPAPNDDSPVTNAAPDSAAESDHTSTPATPTDSQLANETDAEPATEASRANNTETTSKQPQSQPQDELQTAALDTAGTTETNDTTEPDQEIEAAQTTTLDTASTTQTNDATQLDQEIEEGQTDETEAQTDNLQTAARDTANKTATTDTTEPDQEIQVVQTSGPETSGDDPETASATDTKAEKTDATPEDETNNAQETEQTASAPTTNHQSQITNHRNSVNALLQAYAAAYNTSNINQFGALFQPNAETKYASGRQEIKKKYGEFFQSTSKRNVAFKDVRIQLLGNRQFKVTAQYQADWTYPNGRSKTNTGRFQFHLTPADDQLKIWRLNY